MRCTVVDVKRASEYREKKCSTVAIMLLYFVITVTNVSLFTGWPFAKVRPQLVRARLFFLVDIILPAQLKPPSLFLNLRSLSNLTILRVFFFACFLNHIISELLCIPAGG